ncbi:hypothetical protein HYH03_017026 [Edaphochlamys debaryana]|uniref:BACK domain-containing protein n=1 Tax=Edaphochlamys debaryana TaxID=47281 RepID=A0A835XQ68_9CHLO|nr:hypothetical protein HYH03_017026 [Edaphochlamys debaryana]|eukprot:KAG2484144.1 hypothetical protein HYH03_017026 [Edaphochlamys debaryana]
MTRPGPEGFKQVNGKADLPHARSAVRFIYTGELGVSSAADLLGVRRLACYLGVEGAVEACDSALWALARGAPDNPLSGVQELFACRQLLPERDADPGAAPLLDGIRAACQTQLAAHKPGYPTATAASPTAALPLATAARCVAAGVPLGELLVWVFPDAPSVLSDPAAKARAMRLSAASLEALLTCDAFATDDEASVLLLLAEWLGANPAAGSEERTRLCRCIRLAQLSGVYLQGVLPLLRWFPIAVNEHRVLCQALSLPEGPERERLLEQVATAGYEWPPSWVSLAARPQSRADVGRVYGWSVAQADLEREVAKLAAEAGGGPASLRGAFACGAPCLVARGLEVHPKLQYGHGDDGAGVYLSCWLPACLRACNVPTLLGVSNAGSCRLVVWRGPQRAGTGSEPGGDGGGEAAGGSGSAAGSKSAGSSIRGGGAGRQAREVAYSYQYHGERDFWPVGSGYGASRALPLLPAPTAGAAAAEAAEGAAAAAPSSLLLSRWAPYLHEGRISGTLEWLGPQGAAQGYPGDDLTASALRDSLQTACQARLATYRGTATELRPFDPSLPRVPLGELMAWAFPDVPSVLSNMRSKAHLAGVSTTSLEALLSSKSFATDNEATVLLLLAEWLSSHQFQPGTEDAVRDRLCRCIRLDRLSSAYLFGVLPLLPWFPLTPAEHRVLCQAVSVTPAEERQRVCGKLRSLGYDWPTAWTMAASRPPPRLDAGRVHEWSISAEEIKAELAAWAAGSTLSLQAALDPGPDVVAGGFEHGVCIEYEQGSDAAMVKLTCILPICLDVTYQDRAQFIVRPGPCRVRVWKWVVEGEGGAVRREAAVELVPQKHLCLEAGVTQVSLGSLPLLPAPTAAAAAAEAGEGAASAAAPSSPLLSRWSPYLHEGRISGTLEWLGPQGAAQG